MKKIGMVGIGMMGHGIASNVQKHGYELAVLEHPGNQPLDALKAGGARTFTSAAALAARSDLVILVLTGSPQVEAVLTGADGVLQGLRPGTVVIDCSTAIPSSTLRMAEAVMAAGGTLPRCAHDPYAQGSRRRQAQPAGGWRCRRAGRHACPCCAALRRTSRMPARSVPAIA